MAEKVRVIFQGGGARLATLLAAARALQRVCRDEYEIVEAVGVSAGSIAAAAVAGAQPISTIRANILREARTFAPYVRIFKGPPPKKRGILWRLWRITTFPWTVLKYSYLALVVMVFGGSFISHRDLSRALSRVFSDARGQPLPMSALPRLVVFSTLLNQARSKRYPAETVEVPANTDAEPTDFLVGDVLSRSCRLPLIFAGYRTKNMEVDGGIAGNLPVHQVMDARRDEQLRTLVFSFPDEVSEVRGFGAFLARLLSASIDAGVRDARTQAFETGAAVCNLPNGLGTFDFQGAIDALDADRFDKAVEELEGKIERQLKELFGPFGYPVIRPNRFTQEHVANVFDELARRHPYTKLYSARIMIEKGLRRPGLNREDERCYVDTVAPGERFEVCQVGLPFNLTAGPSHFEELDPAAAAGNSITNVVVRVSVGNQEIKTRAFLSFDGVSQKNRILIFVQDDLARFRKLDGTLPEAKIVTRIDGPVFGSFKQRGWDAFSTRSTLGGGVSRLDWICLLQSGQTFLVRDMIDLSPPELAQVVPHTTNIEERFKQWVRGAALAETEIEATINQYCGESIQPWRLESSRRLGWRVDSLGPEMSSGFRFDGQG
ncbi:MAG: patatin-like phospholipase family protein [Terricaulis sp.]